MDGWDEEQEDPRFGKIVLHVLVEHMDGLQGLSCTNSLGLGGYTPCLHCKFYTNVKHGVSVGSEQAQHDMESGRLPSLAFTNTKLISLNQFNYQ